MRRTIFPTLPGEVAVLTTSEFAFDLESDKMPSFDDVCRRCGNDANRALVWIIRFHALKAWRARDDTAPWLSAARMPHICEVAAGFELNDQWEFDADGFCHAIDTTASRMSRRERG